MKRICVIGSLNTDLVFLVDCFPKPGETVTGKEFCTYPGGKGANQAVAARRLGADVAIVGKLGDDLYGRQYVDILLDNGITVDGIGIESGISSGIAVIEIDNRGENHIIIIPGANGNMDSNFIDSRLDLILQYDIFLFQLEIPMDTVLYAIKLLKERGKLIILDPAPAMELPDNLFPCVDFITPNETEIEIITGKKVVNEEDLKSAAGLLIDKGVGTVVAKVGKRGAYVINKTTFLHSQAFDVKVADTTAAGDSFNAGFAFALSRGQSLKECAAVANAVAALSTCRKGAQSAMPDIEQVKAIMGF